MKRTHGQSTTKLYWVWQQMRYRCYNMTHKDYPNYGGRGISVSSEWYWSYEQFRADMGFPIPGMKLERVNNDGPYARWNCVWSSDTTQCRNRRDTVKVVVDGECMCLTDACKLLGLNYSTVQSRRRQMLLTHVEALQSLNYGTQIIASLVHERKSLRR